MDRKLSDFFLSPSRVPRKNHFYAHVGTFVMLSSSTVVPAKLSVLSRDLLSRLEAFLKTDLTWSRARGAYGEAKRERAFFGFELENGRMTPRTAFPEILKEVARALHDAMEGDLDNALTSESWNQCIVNKYGDKQGIGRHTDNKEYGDAVMTVTIRGTSRDVLWVWTEKKKEPPCRRPITRPTFSWERTDGFPTRDRPARGEKKSTR